MFKKIFTKLIYSEKTEKSNWSDAIKQMGIKERWDKTAAEEKERGDKKLAENLEKEKQIENMKKAA